MHLNSQTIAAIFSNKDVLSDKKNKHMRFIGERNPNKLHKRDKEIIEAILEKKKSNDVEKLYEDIEAIVDGTYFIFFSQLVATW